MTNREGEGVQGIDREIARLAVPAFAALIAEPLFLLADSAIVGHLGTTELAGLGIAGVVLQTVVGLFVFLAYGTTSLVARSLGADDRRRALTYGMDGVRLAALLGGVLALVTFVASPSIVAAFDPAPEVAQQADTYLRVAAFGVPALLLILATNGVLRGLQDTRTPLHVMVGMNVANVVLNVALVYGLHWGIAGSAAGTLIAQALGAAALVAVVVRHARAHDAPLVSRPHGMVQAWRTGVPLLIRTVSLRAALLVATYVATMIGTDEVAAHQVAFTVWTFLTFSLDAIAIAGQAITGRLLGASDVAGTRAATRRMVLWGVVAGCVLGLALAAARPLIVPLFTSDAAVQDLIAAALLVAAVQQPVAGVVFVLDGVLIGAGDGTYLAWAGVITLVVFVPLAFAVAWWGGGLVALWWAFSGFMLARFVTLVWRERSDRWMVLGAAQ